MVTMAADGQIAKLGVNCSTTMAFDPTNGGGKQWQGRCKTLAQCQALCTGDCTGFNWWPVKGGSVIFIVGASG